MYKAGQGMPSRIGAMVVGILIAAYASFSWYRWNPFSGFASGRIIDLSVAGVLLIGLAVLFAWAVFKKAGSADYLIDMDDELRKVVWPSVMPLFDPKTEAWGSTYVVIVCSILFTVFIWLVDIILNLVVTRGLIQSVLFT